ncbi:MAG: site-2 protease family protein [Oscillospiraceae bacterium]|nr:site-2 protease family protein [Oscillospiraceae bacterium]
MFRGPLLEIFSLLFSGNPSQSQIISCVLSVFSVLVIIFVVFPIHECAHGLMAKILGDDTAERQGRLTLNPFAHIDPFGALAMFICRIGWAKPTPVNLRNCTKVKQRTALALTSLAGPLANVLLSYILVIAAKIVLISSCNGDPNELIMYVVTGVSPSGSMNDVIWYVVNGLIYTALINIYLAVFNLVPIPPFDGFNILSSFLPGKAVYVMQRNQQIIYWVFFALLVFGILDVPFGLASNGIMWLLDKGSFFVPDHGMLQMII